MVHLVLMYSKITVLLINEIELVSGDLHVIYICRIFAIFLKVLYLRNVTVSGGENTTDTIGIFLSLHHQYQSRSTV